MTESKKIMFSYTKGFSFWGTSPRLLYREPTGGPGLLPADHWGTSVPHTLLLHAP